MVASMAEAVTALNVEKLKALAPNGKAGGAAAALQLAALTGAGAAANGLKTPLADGDQAPKSTGGLLLGDAAASAVKVDGPETAGAAAGGRAWAPNGKAGGAAAALQLAALTGAGAAAKGLKTGRGVGVHAGNPKLAEIGSACDHLMQRDMSAAMRNTASTGFDCDAAHLLFLFRPCVTHAIASASRRPSSMSCTASA